MRRRALLGSVAAVGVSGCIGAVITPGVKRAEDPWRNLQTTDTDAEKSARGQVVLGVNRFAAREYEVTSGAQYRCSVTVTGEKAMDVYLMERAEFEKYTSNESARYHGGSIVDRSQGTEERRLESGSYRVVFDNTDWDHAQPDGELTADFEVGMTFESG